MDAVVSLCSWEYQSIESTALNNIKIYWEPGRGRRRVRLQIKQKVERNGNDIVGEGLGNRCNTDEKSKWGFKVVLWVWQIGDYCKHYLELERWLNSEENLLLFQRSQVEFAAFIWRLTTISNSSPGGLMPFSGLQAWHTCSAQTNLQTDYVYTQK